jgi:lipopolysaccharide transport system ATP-binding protein
LVQSSKNIIARIRHPFNASKIDPQTHEEFWAIKDINFEINQGDKVGIIGRNGAGKSTLLKVLSRITEPTTGKIHINGRIASLLEVGTGFHPELTGRENIFLNGAVLGMRKAEIKNKFDEIVAFAEVEKFLDTPVKRYSSGMYVRLAFAVAAHLEPDVLIVDEVLAVGDVDFQKKCLGKMEEFGNEGRTVLFVSHNIGAIQQLCSRALLLESGKLRLVGNIEEIVDKYLFSTNLESGRDNLLMLPRDNGLSLEVKIDSFQLYNSKMEKAEFLKFGETFYVEIIAIGMEYLNDLQVVVGIDSIYGERIATTLNARKLSFDLYKKQKVKAIVKIQECFIPGRYNITIAIRQSNKNLIDRLKAIGSFTVNSISDERFINEMYVPGGYLHLNGAKWSVEK